MRKETTRQPQEIILDADGYFKSLIEDIDQAKLSVSLETYIFNEDKFGRKVTLALVNAAKRQVKIRVLIDGVGLSTWGPSLKEMEAAGIAVRIYHPIPWSIRQWTHANFKSSWLAKIIFSVFRLNSRNHRKTCLIDKKIAYIGSVNITQRHLSKKLGGEGWVDTVVRITNTDFTELHRAFNLAWSQFPLKKTILKLFYQKSLNPIFRLNYSRKRRRILYKSLLQKMKESKKRVWVTSAYFNPDFFLLKVLLKAARRGIDVKVLLPHKSDVAIMPYVIASFYESMIKEGVATYEYLPSILHSKILIIDDWYCVGSSNLNYRSLFHDLEVDVNVRSLEAQKILEKNFIDNIKKSHQIDITDLKKITWVKKIYGRLLLIGRYFF